MEILFLLVVIGLAILPVAAFRFFRRHKNTKTKEQRRAETITALIILAILLILAVLRQSIKQDRINDVIQNSNTTQTQER
jgi:hypothetical protein